MEDERVFEYIDKGDIPSSINIVESTITISTKRDSNSGRIIEKN